MRCLPLYEILHFEKEWKNNMKNIIIIFSLIFASCGRIDNSTQYSCSANLNSRSWQQTSNPGGAFSGSTNLFYATTVDISSCASLLQDSSNSGKYLTLKTNLYENSSVSVIDSSNIILAQLNAGGSRNYVIPNLNNSLQSYNLAITAIDSRVQTSWSVPWQNFSNNLILTFTVPDSQQFISNISNFPTGTITIQLNDN